MRCPSGGDLLVEAEVLFDGGDADFELAEPCVQTMDFAGEVGLDAADLCIEFFRRGCRCEPRLTVERTLSSVVLGLLVVFFFVRRGRVRLIGKGFASNGRRQIRNGK
jgi:hypothetical protein